MSSTSATGCDEVDADVRRLLEAVYERYAIDFREYATASITRRVLNGMRAEQLGSVDGYCQRLLADPDCMERFLKSVTVHVTTMFRDPEFYQTFREVVVPLLRKQPFFRIWHAGCSTGEEVYSLAVLLEEAGIRSRCRIYGTDLSESVLRRAREAIFPLPAMREFTGNYLRAGGRGAFSEYYTASHGRAIIKSWLRSNIVFSRHNLATEGPFNTFDVVLCRNVLIYFNRRLADRVHRLLYESLVPGGILGLGPRETVRFTPCEKHYRVVEANARLFQKAD